MNRLGQKAGKCIAKSTRPLAEQAGEKERKGRKKTRGENNLPDNLGGGVNWLIVNIF
jgi:hypothetical protein